MRTQFDTIFLQALRLALLIRHPRLHRRYWKYEDPKRLPNPVLPLTTNDKWLWRKLFDHSPTLVQISDKLSVRDWLSSVGIDARTTDVLWVGLDPVDIPDHILTQPVVVKTNHACATNIFLAEPNLDRPEIDALAREYLNRDHGVSAHEWAYSKIDRKLFVERFVPNMNTELKFYTFGETVQRIIAIYDALEFKTTDIWIPAGDGTFEWSPHRSVIGEGQARRPLPSWHAQALEIAQTIGKHFDHVRVDILGNENEFWLGEITVYNLGGHFGPLPKDELQLMNNAWDLRNSRFMRETQTGWRRLYADVLLRRLTKRQQAS